MPLKTQLSDAPAPNLTPMIDVVFLIIIFFMVGTNFTRRENKIDIITVPQVDSATAALTPRPQQRVITVFHDGRIALDSETVSLDQLIAKLRDGVAQYKELAVIVRGSATGPFSNVARVLGGIRKAGVSEMDIAVRPSSTGSTR